VASNNFLVLGVNIGLNIWNILTGRSAKRQGLDPDLHQVVFVLCPNYCGSTLLSRILATSSNSSFVNEGDAMEAETIPELRPLFPKGKRWKAEFEPDWPTIREAFIKRWDLRKPILLDKSPPYILRMEGLRAHFAPVKFLLMVRDPYAYAESLIRRSGRSPEKAAQIVRRRMDLQRANLEALAEGEYLFFKYEDLVSDPEGVKVRLVNFIPYLHDIDMDRYFDIHNVRQQERLKIENLNREKIERLSEEQVAILSSEFDKDRALFDYFDYRII
jgi:hypothetical protein